MIYRDLTISSQIELIFQAGKMGVIQSERK